MQTMTRAARMRAYLSRHERQQQARAAAFSRRTPKLPTGMPVTLDPDDLELIERLVRQDRTAVSSALLAVAGIGQGDVMRRAVVASVSEAAGWAQTEGAISPSRAAQIARHAKRALGQHDQAIAA
jgi:hypothetical protein